MAVALEGEVDSVPRPIRGSYPAIPDGWLKYTCFGRPIRGTQIIAVKTPLKKNFHNGLSKKYCPPVTPDERYTYGVSLEDEFTPTQCIERLATSCEGFKLGAVIDLTYTDRYYNKKEFIDAGVKYYKLKVPGKVVPRDDIYEEFKEAVATFLRRLGGTELLAVHCTHGLNRAGYLVCRYLMEQLHLDANTAISEFNDARGHSIEKKHYIQHLKDGCPKDQQSSRILMPGETFSQRRGTKSHRARCRSDEDMNWRSSRQESSAAGHSVVSERMGVKSYQASCPSDKDMDWRSREQESIVDGHSTVPSVHHYDRGNHHHYRRHSRSNRMTANYERQQSLRYQTSQEYHDQFPERRDIARSHFEYSNPHYSRHSGYENRYRYQYPRRNPPIQSSRYRHQVDHKSQSSYGEESGIEHSQGGKIMHPPRN